jgi:hypothetical protein
MSAQVSMRLPKGLVLVGRNHVEISNGQHFSMNLQSLVSVNLRSGAFWSASLSFQSKMWNNDMAGNANDVVSSQRGGLDFKVQGPKAVRQQSSA